MSSDALCQLETFQNLPTKNINKIIRNAAYRTSGPLNCLLKDYTDIRADGRFRLMLAREAIHADMAKLTRFLNWMSFRSPSIQSLPASEMWDFVLETYQHNDAAYCLRLIKGMVSDRCNLDPYEKALNCSAWALMAMLYTHVGASYDMAKRFLQHAKRLSLSIRCEELKRLAQVNAINTDLNISPCNADNLSSQLRLIEFAIQMLESIKHTSQDKLSLLASLNFQKYYRVLKVQSSAADRKLLCQSQHLYSIAVEQPRRNLVPLLPGVERHIELLSDFIYKNSQMITIAGEDCERICRDSLSGALNKRVALLLMDYASHNARLTGRDAEAAKIAQMVQSYFSELSDERSYQLILHRCEDFK